MDELSPVMDMPSAAHAVGSMVKIMARVRSAERIRARERVFIIKDSFQTLFCLVCAHL